MVARDFQPLVFSLLTPYGHWGHNQEYFANSVSNSRRYYKKERESASSETPLIQQQCCVSGMAYAVSVGSQAVLMLNLQRQRQGRSQYRWNSISRESATTDTYKTTLIQTTHFKVTVAFKGTLFKRKCVQIMNLSASKLLKAKNSYQLIEFKIESVLSQTQLILFIFRISQRILYSIKKSIGYDSRVHIWSIHGKINPRGLKSRSTVSAAVSRLIEGMGCCCKLTDGHSDWTLLSKVNLGASFGLT